MKDIEKRIGELEEMIDLAEKISINIEGIKQHHHSIMGRIVFIMFSFSALVVVLLIWLTNLSYSLIYLGIGIFIFSLLIYVFGKVNYIEESKAIEIESKILQKLLNTIFPYKTSIFRQPHNMKMKEAIIDMRLSRLKFTYKVDIKEKIEENEMLPIENVINPQPKEPAPTP